ncbi:glycosyltransferase family 4 protein [Methyloversatilis discipulorum]|uniref:glycosyltransferase family 4 protein n=1 Tax=Methyloversatilis discipulorum TaxID=1119528 RepID=UPI00036EA7E1|nr:glycosyltransferase family 1 protein [Methyloversatilis discipulorum]
MRRDDPRTDIAFTVERLQAADEALRIAVVTETWPPEVNGVAMSLKRMVDGLLARGHRVQLIRPKQHATDAPLRDGPLREVLARGVPIPKYGSLRVGLPAKQKLARLWTLERPDLVHLVTEGPLGWSAMAAARKLKLPVTSDFRTNFDAYSAHYGIRWLKRPIAAYLRRFHNLGHATFVPTQALQAQLTDCGYRNIEVVSRGVDTALFSPARRSQALRAAWGAAPDDLVVAFVSRLAPEKNLDLVARAFEALRRERPDARMLWVGDGPARETLAQQYPHHLFAGMRSGEDLATHYASADLFLFGSLTETFGNVLTEALASGLPVVSYAQAAAAELIEPGRNGLLAPPADEAAFIEQTLRAGRDDGLRTAMATGARRSVEQLDWNSVAETFARRLRNAVSSAETLRRARDDAF